VRSYGAEGWAVQESLFDFRQGKFFLLSEGLRPALGSIQPLIQYIPGLWGQD
jgi:hypothetical protein